MGDNWDDDWDEDAEPPSLPQLPNQKPAAAAPAESADKFAGEDEGEEEPSYVVPESQKSKKPDRSRYEDKGGQVEDDTPLDDPLAEKMRKQRLVEAADLKVAQDLFGSDTSLDKMRPKTLREYETFGRTVALQYLKSHEQAPHYKGLLKALLKSALENLPLQETKDLETTIAGLRSDKIKADAADKAAAKKAGKKKTLSMGSKGDSKGVSAGLDDYKYDSVANGDDDYDFM